MSAWEIVLVAALGWVGFAYVGYPLALLALARLAPRPVRAADVSLPVSLVITVHDEEAQLPGKLENALALEHAGPLEVLVASDGSTDGTETVARGYADRGVRLVARPVREGKEAAQAAAIRAARGEVLVFTDAAARLDKDALRAILRPFADPEVGCVTSEDVVPAGGGEGAYVRYEMAIRRLESRVGSVVGLSGSFFAVRRALCDPWPADLASDFRCALEALRRGRRAVCAPDARARFGAARDPGHEWRRRVRTARRGIAVLSAYRELLHPRHGRVAFLVLGHKLARFTVWIALVAAAVAALAAAPHSAWAAGVAGLGAAALALAGLALASPTVAAWRLPRIALYFTLVNAAIAAAWWHHLRGERAVTWQPTRR